MSYEYLSHTADIKVRIEAKNLEECFKQAGFSVIDLVVNIDDVIQKKVIDIVLKAKDVESIFYDFISELIYLIDAKFFVFSGYQNIKLKKVSNGFELKAQLVGDNYHNYRTKTHVKAMTYNQLNVKKIKQGFRIDFVLDI